MRCIHQEDGLQCSFNAIVNRLYCEKHGYKQSKTRGGNMFWKRKTVVKPVPPATPLPDRPQPSPYVKFGWGYACPDHHVKGCSFDPVPASPKVKICEECGKRLKLAVVKASYEYVWRGRYGGFSTPYYSWGAEVSSTVFERFLTV